MSKRIPRRGSPQQYAAGTTLPIGKSCGDCRHFVRCGSLGFAIEQDQVCEWTPSLFGEAPASAGSGLLKVSLEDRLKGGARHG